MYIAQNFSHLSSIKQCLTRDLFLSLYISRSATGFSTARISNLIRYTPIACGNANGTVFCKITHKKHQNNMPSYDRKSKALGAKIYPSHRFCEQIFPWLFKSEVKKLQLNCLRAFKRKVKWNQDSNGNQKYISQG